MGDLMIDQASKTPYIKVEDIPTSTNNTWEEYQSLTNYTFLGDKHEAPIARYWDREPLSPSYPLTIAMSPMPPTTYTSSWEELDLLERPHEPISPVTDPSVVNDLDRAEHYLLLSPIMSESSNKSPSLDYAKSDHQPRDNSSPLLAPAPLAVNIYSTPALLEAFEHGSKSRGAIERESGAFPTALYPEEQNRQDDILSPTIVLRSDSVITSTNESLAWTTKRHKQKRNKADNDEDEMIRETRKKQKSNKSQAESIAKNTPLHHLSSHFAGAKSVKLVGVVWISKDGITMVDGGGSVEVAYG